MARFALGDRVFRGVPPLGATVTAVIEATPDEVIYEVAYDEGGSGAWPESALFASLEDWRAALPDCSTSRLAALAADIKARVATRRWQAEIAGIVHAGKPVATDAVTQGKIAAIALAAVVDQAYTVKWKFADGAFATLDATEVLVMARAARNHVQACYDNEAMLAALIDVAPDAASLLSIDLEAGWPA